MSVQGYQNVGKPYMDFLRKFYPNIKYTTIEEISRMTYQDGTPLVDSTDMGSMSEVLKVISSTSDEDQALMVLRTIKDSEEKMPWSLDSIKSVIDQAELEYSLTRSKSSGVKTGKACRVCSADNYLYVNIQTRSADEPETVYTVCLECTNKTMV